MDMEKHRVYSYSYMFPHQMKLQANDVASKCSFCSESPADCA